MMWESASCMMRMTQSVGPPLFQVRAEPVEHAAPGICRGAGSVGVGADVAVEAVPGVGVAHDVVVDRRLLEGMAQGLDVVDRDRLVLVTEETEPGRLQALGLAGK